MTWKKFVLATRRIFLWDTLVLIQIPWYKTVVAKLTYSPVAAHLGSFAGAKILPQKAKHATVTTTLF